MLFQNWIELGYWNLGISKSASSKTTYNCINVLEITKMGVEKPRAKNGVVCDGLSKYDNEHTRKQRQQDPEGLTKSAFKQGFVLAEKVLNK